MTAPKAVVMVHVSAQENASLKINAQFLLLFIVPEKINRTRLVPIGAVQVVDFILL